MNDKILNLLNEPIYKIWKMDTSHHSILKNFKKIKSSYFSLSRIGNLSNNKFKISNGEFTNSKGNEKLSFSAVHQYIRVLVFFNILNKDEIGKFSTLTNMINSLCDSNKSLNLNKTFLEKNEIDYISTEFPNIIKNIEELLLSDYGVFSKATLKIIKMAKFFLEIKRESNNDIEQVKIKLEKFTMNNNIKEKNKKGYIDEYKNQYRYLDYYEIIIDSLYKKKFSKEIEISYIKDSFEGIGLAGEIIAFKYLQQKDEKNIVWESQKNKYSPIDFKTKNYFYEVKATSTLSAKESFHWSKNEYNFAKNNSNYKIIFIQNLTIQKVKNIIKKYLNKKQIVFNKLLIREIKVDDLFGDSFKLSSKGYWVRRIK